MSLNINILEVHLHPSDERTDEAHPGQPTNKTKQRVTFEDFVDSRYMVSDINKHYEFALQSMDEIAEENQRALIYLGMFYILIGRSPTGTGFIYSTIVGNDDFYSASRENVEIWLWENWVKGEVQS